MDIVEWLLDSDPAIRWQVMRDLTDAPEEHVAAERARVATEGWGARLLALQRQDGQWDGGIPTFTSSAEANWWQSLPPERKGTLFPQWTSTTWSLMLLRAFGLDPASPEARRAVRLVREHCRWEHDGEPFFAGEVEPCINGRRVAEAIDLVESKRDSDGRWPLENPHPGQLHFAMDEGEGRPSRWNTLRAMRVLRWYEPTPRSVSSGSGSASTG